MSKLNALDEARRWLRGLSFEDANELRDKLGPATRGAGKKGRNQAARRRPYEHPYYWSAFVLMGSPN